MVLPILLAVTALSAAEITPACELTILTVRVRDNDPEGSFVLGTADGKQLRVLGQDFIHLRDWKPGEQLKLCVLANQRAAQSPFFDVTDVQRTEHVVARQMPTKKGVRG